MLPARWNHPPCRNIATKIANHQLLFGHSRRRNGCTSAPAPGPRSSSSATRAPRDLRARGSPGARPPTGSRRGSSRTSCCSSCVPNDGCQNRNTATLAAMSAMVTTGTCLGRVRVPDRDHGPEYARVGFHERPHRLGSRCPVKGLRSPRLLPRGRGRPVRVRGARRGDRRPERVVVASRTVRFVPTRHEQGGRVHGRRRRPPHRSGGRLSLRPWGPVRRTL